MSDNGQQQQQPAAGRLSGGAFQQYMSKQLRDPEVVGAVVVNSLEKAEAKTGIKREHMAYAFIAVYALYLMLGGMAGLACNIVGFAYPCYASFVAIRSEGKDDDTVWLTYWCVFGAFSLIDAFADPIMTVFPVYWVLKCAFMLYLYHPLTMGALTVYKKVVEPMFLLLQGRIGGSKTAGAGAGAAPKIKPKPEEPSVHCDAQLQAQQQLEQQAQQQVEQQAQQQVQQELKDQ